MTDLRLDRRPGSGEFSKPLVDEAGDIVGYCDTCEHEVPVSSSRIHRGWRKILDHDRHVPA